MTDERKLNGSPSINKDYYYYYSTNAAVMLGQHGRCLSNNTKSGSGSRVHWDGNMPPPSQHDT